jgi:hypothetical protein
VWSQGIELPDLLLGPGPRLLGHLLLLELVLELLDLVLELVALAELLLDRAHLLVQVVLLLRALHLLLDARADLLLDLEDLDLRLHEAEDLLQALGRIHQLQQALAVLDLEIQVGDQGVGESPGRRDLGDRVQHLGRHLLVELHVALEGGVDRAHHGVGLDVLLVALTQDLGDGGEMRLGLGNPGDAGPGLAFHEHLDRAIGQAQELDDGAEGPDLEQVLLAGIVEVRLALGDQEELPTRRHRLLQGPDRLGPPHEERHHHVREDDDVP